MPDQEPNDYIIPVVTEEVHTDAVPVQTGGVRVVKRVEPHEEVIERELRQGRVDVKRVPMNHPVPGPMESRREGNTLILPVVSEILRVEKQWILTEEIHITQLEELRTVTEKVTLNQEVAEVERLDENGRVISQIGFSRESAKVLASTAEITEPERRVLRGKNASIVKKS